MNYREIFDGTFAHLENLNVDYTYIKPTNAEPKVMKRAEKAIGLQLPPAFRNFYLGFADGLMMFWSTGKERGALEISSLKDLVGNTKDFRDLPSTIEDFSFVPSMGVERVREISGLMKAWLPFKDDGEGNSLCVDCGSEAGAVVYYEHDWYDVGSGSHGHILAPDFATFVFEWSRVCFLEPTRWPEVLKGCEVGWDAGKFSEAFRR